MDHSILWTMLCQPGEAGWTSMSGRCPEWVPDCIIPGLSPVGRDRLMPVWTCRLMPTGMTLPGGSVLT